MKNNWQTWLKIACILIALIIFLAGFLSGYFYGDKSCFEDPLVYGIEKINKANNDEFLCSCNSISGKVTSFSFDKDGAVAVEEEILSSKNISWALP